MDIERFHVPVLIQGFRGGFPGIRKMFKQRNIMKDETVMNKENALFPYFRISQREKMYGIYFKEDLI